MGEIVHFKSIQTGTRSDAIRTGIADVVGGLGGKISLLRHIDSDMNSNYVSISRIQGNVADELVKLSRLHEVGGYWIDLQILESYLHGLGKVDLEATVLVNTNPFEIPGSPLEGDYLEAAMYLFNPSTRQVKLTPTPFYAGSNATDYFVKRSSVG